MTTTIQETLSQEVAEGGSALLTGYLEDELGAYVPLAAVGTVKFWLDNLATGLTINSKADTDIKNANNGTLAEVQEVDPRDNVLKTRTKFTLRLVPADNLIVDTTKRGEWHLGTVKASYNGATGMMQKPFLFRVVNLSRTP